MEIPLLHLQILSVLLFFIGVYGFVTRKNLLAVLMSSELVLNAVALSFVSYNYYLHRDDLEGVFFSLFIIGIAAAEAALAIAIIVSMYRVFRSVNVEDASDMKY